MPLHRMNLSSTEVSDAVDGPLPERARLECDGIGTCGCPLAIVDWLPLG